VELPIQVLVGLMAEALERMVLPVTLPVLLPITEDKEQTAEHRVLVVEERLEQVCLVVEVVEQTVLAAAVEQFTMT
jgi:hypothetical protein